MSVTKFIKAECLNKLLKGNVAGLKILDCTFDMAPKPDYLEWRKQNYGKFEELMNKNSIHKEMYLQSHIPTARFMDLDVAVYPSRFERLAHYPPELFQEYMQLLGLYNDDQIMLYSRGNGGGMISSLRCNWLLKVYGHKDVTVLDGGLESWQKHGFEVETSTDLPKVERGTWMAQNFQHRLITFEEMTEKDPTGKDIFENSEKYNLLDARARAQYNNEEDTGFNLSVVPGSFIPGTHNSPAGEMVGADGELLPAETIKERLARSQFDPRKPTITMCNTGMQASMLASIVQRVYPDAKIRVFSGGMREVEARDPKRISGGVKPVNGL